MAGVTLKGQEVLISIRFLCRPRGIFEKNLNNKKVRSIKEKEPK